MANETVKTATDALTTSLQNTQKNATNTETSVDQVLSMSGKDLHEKTVTAILDNDDLDMKTKLTLIHRENDYYNQREENNTNRVLRLQASQTRYVGAATNWWAANWVLVIRVIAAGAVGIAVVTPGGRRFIIETVKKLAA